MTELACLDGTIAPVDRTSIPVSDEGFLRGDGAFEVIRVYAGVPFALEDHLARIERSAANLRLDGPFPSAELLGETAELLEARGGAGFDGALRWVLTRGGRRLLMTEPLREDPERVRLGLVTYAPTRVLDGVKSLSYAANMLCSRLARERGFDEALLVTPHGRVLEGPTSSIFWVSADGRLCTPPLDDHVLASITRARLIELLDVEERSAATEEIAGWREAFLASTIREVQPVAAIEERDLGPAGEVTREARGVWRAHVDAELSTAFDRRS